MPSRTIWFIRHAQSRANAGHISPDLTQTPLSEVGQQQAEHLAGAFTRQPDLIITSPYLRTQQTAQPTIARFPSARREEWKVQEFTAVRHERTANTSIPQRESMYG